MKRLLEIGHELPIDTAASLGGLVCTTLLQRNWSRVGLAVAPGRPDARYFVKQSVDRCGEWHTELWRQEGAGAQLAQRVLGDLVVVPRVVLADEQHLLNVLEYQPIETPDELLRRDARALSDALPGILQRLVLVIDALRAAPADALTGLAKKQRPFGAPNALNFKGFDVRNCGLVQGTAAPEQRLVLFDLGRPYVAPVEELAAKLLVSVGLLNWGSPLKRFLRGPELEHLELARTLLGKRVNRAAILAEIELQRGFRLREFKARSSFERLGKQLGVMTVGKRYLDRLERWAWKLPA